MQIKQLREIHIAARRWFVYIDIFRNACLEVFFFCQCQQTMHQNQHAYHSRWSVFQFRSFWLKCNARGAVVMHDDWQLSASASFQWRRRSDPSFFFFLVFFPEAVASPPAACVGVVAGGGWWRARQRSPRDGERVSHSNQLRVIGPRTRQRCLYWQ